VPAIPGGRADEATSDRPSVASYDHVVGNTSAGNDSQAALNLAVEAADLAGGRGRLVAMHTDLGRVEWPGAKHLAAEHPAHYPAYAVGLPRLSFSFCLLASRDALVRSAQLRPRLAAEYAAAEQRMGQWFRDDLSMADIVALAGRTEHSLGPVAFVAGLTHKGQPSARALTRRRPSRPHAASSPH
jgi:hypothetical protein